MSPSDLTTSYKNFKKIYRNAKYPAPDKIKFTMSDIQSKLAGIEKAGK